MKDAKKFLDKYKRVDVAIDAYYGDPAALASTAKHSAAAAAGGASTSKLNALFDKYKGESGRTVAVACAQRCAVVCSASIHTLNADQPAPRPGRGGDHGGWDDPAVRGPGREP